MKRSSTRANASAFASLVPAPQQERQQLLIGQVWRVPTDANFFAGSCSFGEILYTHEPSSLSQKDDAAGDWTILYHNRVLILKNSCKCRGKLGRRDRGINHRNLPSPRGTENRADTVRKIHHDDQGNQMSSRCIFEHFKKAYRLCGSKAGAEKHHIGSVD